MRVGIAGITGRMGREIVRAAADRQGVEIGGGLGRIIDHDSERPEDWSVVEKATELLPGIDIWIDFSVPEVTPDLVDACCTLRKPLVSGVTGLTHAQEGLLRDAGKEIAVFRAMNMSIGIAVMIEATKLVASLLPEADIEISERHHRHKVDAPSGTAMSLLAVFDEGVNRMVPGRSGHAPRKAGSIGAHALRGGGNAGEHEVIFMSDGEEVTLHHRALSRRTFADGALDAARWLVDQPPGFYGMADLLRSLRT